MAAEFELEGARYEMPDVNTINIDEAQIVWDFCKFAVEDVIFETDEVVNEKIGNPMFKRALICIAYKRAHPEADIDEVRKMAGTVKIVEATNALYGDKEAEEVPLASTSEPNEPSKRSSLSNDDTQKPTTGTPGDDSQRSSDAPDDQREPITDTRSDTSSTSPHLTSAA